MREAPVLPGGGAVAASPHGRPAVGWRVLAYLGLLVAFTAAGRYAGGFLPGDRLGWLTTATDTAAAVAAGCLVLIRLDDRPAGALGFPLSRRAPGELARGLALGVALNAGAALLLFASGTAYLTADAGTVAGYLGSLTWTLAYFGLAAAYEEALFRGYLFQAAAERAGPLRATLVLSALFALAHLGNPGVGLEAIANIFLAGVLLSLAYLRTRSLWFATGVHAGWNWAMASLFAFPVSGLTLVDTPLYDGVEAGADWWTGGTFGPEAGVAGTLLLLAGAVWLRRTRALREAPEMRPLRPLVDARLAPEAG